MDRGGRKHTVARGSHARLRPHMKLTCYSYDDILLEAEESVAEESCGIAHDNRRWSESSRKIIIIKKAKKNLLDSYGE